MKLVLHLLYLFPILLMMPSRTGAFDSFRIGAMFFFVVLAILTEWFFERKKKNVFRLDVLFITGFLIVHFQWPLMFLFEVDLRNLRVEALIEYVNYGTWLASIGLISWLIGWGCVKFKISIKERIVSVDYSKVKWVFAFLFGLFLLVAGRNYLTGAIYRGDSDSAAAEGVGAYVQLLLSCSSLALIACFVTDSAIKSKKTGWSWRKLDKVVLVLLGAYVFMFLAVGDRGGAVQAVSATLLLGSVFIYTIDIKKFAVLALTGAFVLTVIGFGRDSGAKTEKRSMVKDGLEELQELEVDAPYVLTVELANSSICLYSSVAEVSRREQFFYGSLWRSDLMAQVPFLQHLYARFYGWDDKEMSSAGYITYVTYGEGSVTGTGSSIIADLYLNWGPVGVMICMFGLGCLYRRVDIGLNKGEGVLWIVAAAGLGAAAFYSARATFWVFLRPILWSSALVYFFVNVRTVERAKKLSKIADQS